MKCVKSVCSSLLTCPFLISLTAVSNVHAQTTTIAGLQFPPRVVLQNGVAQVNVTFTVTYSGLPSGGYLLIMVILSNSSFVKGSGTSSPDPCLSNEGTTFAGTAVCYFAPNSSSGTESASFILALESAQLYNLDAGAAMLDKSLKSVSGSNSGLPFTITVTG